MEFSSTYQIEFSAGFKIGFDVLVAIIFLTTAIGTKSLIQHASAVESALSKNNIDLARQRIAMIVSRDTAKSDENAINRATIESVLENGSDAIFAAIFWFVVLGVPGVVLYRLANTLDAMWGYRTKRFYYFGWASARIDDVMNWLPARLTAMSYALAGNTRAALRCWFTQARHWHGINPGVVMASGAGALEVKLGGKALYHEQEIERPDLGLGNIAETKDIKRAIQIVQRSILIWVACIVMINYLNSTF
jgi:adenosylcobinamide-phosphate synthase